MKNTIPLSLRWAVGYGAILFLLASLISCATQKNAEKYYDKHPGKLAEECAEKFPVKDSVVVRDSVRFDTLYLQTDPEIIKDSFYIKGDTIIREVTKKCPPHQTVVKTVRHDSIIIRRDRAFETVQENQIRILHIENSKLTNEVSDLKDKRDWWRQICLLTWALIGLYVILKIKKVIPF